MVIVLYKLARLLLVLIHYPMCWIIPLMRPALLWHIQRQYDTYRNRCWMQHVQKTARIRRMHVLWAGLLWQDVVAVVWGCQIKD